MPLPKIKLPIFTCQILSHNGPVKFKPFTVKEEKILLVAKESADDDNAILEAVKQIINNCLITELDVSKLPIFDIQYLFIQLRSKSIGNIIELSLRDKEDKKLYKVEVNLDDIKYNKPDGHSNNIKINNDTGIVMKYPTVDMIKSKDFKKDPLATFELIKDCVDYVYSGDSIYKSAETPRSELDEFFENLPSEMVGKFNDYITTIPLVSHTVSYVNSNGKKIDYEVSNLRNFF